MTHTPFSAAITASVASLNAGGLTHGQWAEVAGHCAHAFASFGIDDPTVRFAAALGGLIQSQPAPESVGSSVMMAFAGTATPVVDSAAREAVRVEGRIALRFATHAAVLNSRGLPLILLAAVERDLMGSPPIPAVAPLESALENWRSAIAMVGRSNPDLSPHVAVAIAVNQKALLQRGRELLASVDINPDIPGSPDRLLEGIESSIGVWAQAAERWYDSSLDTVPHDANRSATRLLSLAATDLSRALTESSSPSTQLEALMRTGFGGNLIASIVATNPSCLKGSAVVPAARALELITDHFTDHRFGPPFRDRPTPPAPPHPPPAPPVVANPTAVGDAPAVALSLSQHSPVNQGPPSDRTGLDAPVRWLTAHEERELAQRRDAGLLAQAALDGDPTALRLSAAATKEELHRLANGGRAAVAQLVASMIPTMGSTNRWIPRWERADALQNAAVDVAAAAARWDPDKGARWLTFAWNNAYWASTDSRKALDARPVPFAFDLDGMAGQLREAEPGPEQALLDKLAESEKRHLTHQITTLEADEIRPDLLSVVMKYHGLGGEPPKNFGEIAKEHDSSTSTVSRHYHEAIEVLRGLFPAPAAEERKPWRRPEHAPPRPGAGPRR